MNTITRKLTLIGALLLTAVTANAATMTIRLINLGTVIPPSSWSIYQNTYKTALDSYNAIYAGQGISVSVTTTANSIDWVYSGIALNYYESFYSAWAGEYMALLNNAVASVGLRYEITYDGQALAETKIEEIRQWWPGAANLGDYWSWTNGMSYFWVYSYPWVYSYVTAYWLYTVPIQAGAYYYWIPERGWVYSDGSIDNLWDLE